MEASSIGLVEHRLNGCHIRTAILTNFTQDHLDYHGDMQAYWQAKQSLFEWPGLATAVINWDDPKGQALCEMLASTPVQVWTVSMHSTQANVYARHVRTTAQGMEFEVVCGEQSQSVSSQCVGEFNVMNMLGVMAVLCQAGHRLSAVVDACHALQPVPGRMQTWGRVGTPAVVVDYAHTPDAVAKALQALRPWAHARGGRLYCVLGSGGDRDSSKRAPMGRSAEAHADQVCLTSDNPRSEDPQHIVQQMLAGMTQPHKAIQQLDRAKAISDSIAQAQAADVVLVAGKGHETYQEVQGQKLPFSDSDHVVLALQRWGHA
jgi:UDP-N-acetylmuramoyl-L-alanyl-D-glutamate--2,6-diaminopimelate ligase